MNDYIMQIVRACTYVHLSTNGADGYPETRHALRLFGFIEFVTDAATRNKYWRDEYQRFGYGGPDVENFILMRFMPEKYKYYIGVDMKTGEV